MSRFSPSRRQFLSTAAVGSAALGLGDLGFLSRLPRVRAEDTQTNGNVVQFRPEVEPLVRLLEDTPQDKLLEKVAEKIHAGTTYKEILAALMLAGVRNIQPRPAVGFKFHGVLVVNSAHLAAMSSPDEHRWLPIFWALDYFKSTQAQDEREGDWTMAPVKESAVPDSAKARAAFIAAMDGWDAEAADAAAAGLARAAGMNDVYELLFRYGARDFRSIGHKAIYVANSLRTLQCIGWEHAEPIIRGVAYALQNHEGSGNPATGDFDADRHWRRNLELAKKLPESWAGGKLDSAATQDVVKTLREGSSDDAADLAVELLAKRGVHPQSVWDGILCGGGELLFRQRGIPSLHALTTANALHYAYKTSCDEDTRKMMLLQAASFIPQFREFMGNRGNVRSFPIEAMARADYTSSGGDLVQEIFSDVSGDRELAARKTLTALDKGDVQARDIIDAGRVLIFLKGDDAHDYKFSAAVLEDFYHLSPAWRNRFLAAGVYNLHGAKDRDNPLVERTRAALDT